MPYACIYVPNFPVAAALRAEPGIKKLAVAIFEGKPPLEKIIAVNDAARRLNISADMTKAQAELCTEIALRSRSLLQETSAHAALLDCAQSFSPCVEDAACDTVLIDLAGMESLFGPLPEISCAIFDRAHALGLDANFAIASNPDAALLAARGFSGITVIPAGQETSQLGALPVEVLFPDRLEGDQKKEADRLLETLDRWGIRNLRALAALPQVALTERLGQRGLHLQQLTRGAASRTLVPVEPPLKFEEAVELEHPIVLLEPLAFLLNRLLEQLCTRLASRALCTQEIRLTLELSNLTGIDDECTNAGIPSEIDASNPPMWGQPPSAVRRSEAPLPSGRQTHFTRKLSLPLPMLDAKVFLKLLQLDLNAHPPGAPIVGIHLAAEPARPRSAQGGLFLPPSPEPEKLELTLARIAGMVGEQKVGTVEMLDTHHPEGFRLRRFVAETTQENSHDNDATKHSMEPAAITALRRFRPPLRAQVTLDDGQPARVTCPKKKEINGDVLWRAGPWRFSGDWWEREAWSRDEWDIALTNNAPTNDVLSNDASQKSNNIALYRLVHDLLGGVWFVEGTYD